VAARWPIKAAQIKTQPLGFSKEVILFPNWLILFLTKALLGGRKAILFLRKLMVFLQKARLSVRMPLFFVRELRFFLRNRMFIFGSPSGGGMRWVVS
jgi:hypothetical protein